MCGDIEEEEAGAEQAYAAFLEMAQAAIHDAVEHRGGSRSRLTLQDGPISDDDLHGYMDGLFADILRACVDDGARAPEVSRYRLLSAQAVVLARLAGFLSTQLNLGQDPLRSAIESLMDGYARQEHHDHHHHDHHHHG